MQLQALNKMCAVAGSDSTVVAALCTGASPRLQSFDTQSLAQLFCASVKHSDMPAFPSFMSAACLQLSQRIAAMDGVSAGCVAGALATASQNLSEGDACFADVQSCMVALCCRWLLPPSLALGPQHVAFMCRCCVSSLAAVQAVVGERLSLRGIRHKVADAVKCIVPELNWFSIAHVELLLTLLSNSRATDTASGYWVAVPKKHKKILKATRQRMSALTSSMVATYDTFDTDAARALLECAQVDLSQHQNRFCVMNPLHASHPP